MQVRVISPSSLHTFTSEISLHLCIKSIRLQSSAVLLLYEGQGPRTLVNRDQQDPEQCQTPLHLLYLSLAHTQQWQQFAKSKHSLTSTVRESQEEEE